MSGEEGGGTNVARLSQQVAGLSQQVSDVTALLTQLLSSQAPTSFGKGVHALPRATVPPSITTTHAPQLPTPTSHASAPRQQQQPPPPPQQQHHISRSMSLESMTSDEEHTLRPTQYAHKPEARLDGLEAENFSETKMLDALKLQSFEGFYNLAMFILFFAISYIVLRNVAEKGSLLRWHDFVCPQQQLSSALAAGAMVFVYAWSLLLLIAVRLWIARRLSWSALLYTYIALQCVHFVAPITFIYLTPIGPLPAASVLLVTIVLGLKMHSYLTTNYAMHVEHVARYGSVQAHHPPLSSGTPAAGAPTNGAPALAATRQRRKKSQRKAGRTPSSKMAGDEDDGCGSETEDGATPRNVTPHATAAAGAGAALAFAEGVSPSPSADERASALLASSRSIDRLSIKAWPYNVNLRGYLYFIMAPTLVYEPRYPRTRNIRWAYVGRKLLEMGLCAVLQYATFKQFMLPVMQHPSRFALPVWIAPVASFSFDLMKLALPSLVIWLTGFYSIFHCWLNVLAELTRFADRYFYSSWWNATTLDAFWRKWNVPVHEWCLRHVYVDLQHYTNVNKNMAVFATFFISAVFHELIFSVSFKTFRPWFFLGMLLQIPLIAMSRQWANKRRGNYLVWWSLFSGQPLLELLYFREYFATQDNFFCGS